MLEISARRDVTLLLNIMELDGTQVVVHKEQNSAVYISSCNEHEPLVYEYASFCTVIQLAGVVG